MKKCRNVEDMLNLKIILNIRIHFISELVFFVKKF